MHRDLNAAPELIEAHRERVDEKWHVVVHDLHDRVVGVPTIALDIRIEYADLGSTWGAVACPTQMTQDGACEIARLASEQVVLGDILAVCSQ